MKKTRLSQLQQRLLISNKLEAMEKLIKELKKLITFKDTCDIDDVVLIAAVEPQMLVYAKVIDIERDSGRRDEWWVVTMAMLSIPPQQIKWTLRTPQMTGQETFTMGGEERFIKAVEFETPPREEEEPKTEGAGPKGSFIKRIK